MTDERRRPRAYVCARLGRGTRLTDAAAARERESNLNNSFTFVLGKIYKTKTHAAGRQVVTENCGGLPTNVNSQAAAPRGYRTHGDGRRV